MKIILNYFLFFLISAFAGVGVLHVGELTGFVGVLTVDGIRK